jgi:hypothetical protein
VEGVEEGDMDRGGGFELIIWRAVDRRSEDARKREIQEDIEILVRATR